MHRLSASFILGYHGCRKSVGEKLLAGADFEPSDNDAAEAFVVGAIIDLGSCLDLTTSASIELVRSAFDEFVKATTRAGNPMPVNTKDLLRRHLDCAVIRHLHEILKSAGASPLQSVKGIFTEGEPVYVGAGIREKRHVQVALLDASCIKGVFRVPRRHLT